MTYKQAHQARVSVQTAVALVATAGLYLVASETVKNFKLPFDQSIGTWIWLIIGLFIFDLTVFVSELNRK